MNPDLASVHNNLGLACSKKGMVDEAVSAYKKAVDINPDLTVTHYNLGVVYLVNGLDPMAADYFYKAGLMYLRKGDREGATKAYNGLKRTTSKKLEQSLHKKLYPGKEESEL